jgi:hypothetical protein
MILHHYNLSPFSEKIRLMLGYSELAWSSAISPAMPPRPIVDPLAGGYRRIPIAQVGADIFCDTRLISSEIAILSKKPTLAKENCDKHVIDFVDHVDSAVFMSVVRQGTPLKSLTLMIMNFTPWQAVRFMQDRAKIGKTSSLRVSSSKAQEIVIEFKSDIESKLASNKFLFGDEPCIADFSAYHVLWFAKKICSANPFAKFPKASQWMNRMEKLGHGQKTKISKTEVFKVATDNSPRPIPKKMQNDTLVGQLVEIKPSDYAKDAVQGKLVGISELRWIVERQTDRFGTVNVHFPRQGFELNRV